MIRFTRTTTTTTTGSTRTTRTIRANNATTATPRPCAFGTSSSLLYSPGAWYAISAEANITDRGMSWWQRTLLLAKRPGARRTQRMLFDLLKFSTPSNPQFCQVVAEYGVAHALPLGMTNHLYISGQGGSRMLHSLRHCPTNSFRSADPKAPGSSSSLLRSCRRTGSQGALRVWAPWASPGARSRVSSQRAAAATCLGRQVTGDVPVNSEAQISRGAGDPTPLGPFAFCNSRPKVAARPSFRVLLRRRAVPS